MLKIRRISDMFLRRAVQVSTVLIYWFVIVPVIAKYLTDIKWMRKAKWTRKKVGFYGIAAFAFIFVYFIAMYAYVWCKRWERDILAQEKRQQQQQQQTTGKGAKDNAATALVGCKTTAAEIVPSVPAIGEPLTRSAALGALVRIRPARPPPQPPVRSIEAIAHQPSDNCESLPTVAVKNDAIMQDTCMAAATGTRSKLKIVRAAPKLPAVHRSLPVIVPPVVSVAKVNATSPLVEEHPLAGELERRRKSNNRAERLTAELTDILRRYYRISTGSEKKQQKCDVEKM